MSRLVERLLGQRKLVFSLAALITLLGAYTWATMTRQEDPEMPSYWGQAVAVFPGADAETVERLVLEPLEEKLAEVDQIRYLDATAYVEAAVLDIELWDGIDDIDEAWDDVRQALNDAAAELPEGVSAPTLEDSLSRLHVLVYALTGSADPVVLDRAADALKHDMLAIPGVSRVHILAPPGQQVTVELDDAAARRLGLTATALAGQLARRSEIVPGGDVVVAGRAVALRPQTDYRDLADLANAPIALASGEMVPLAAVAQVRHGATEPVKARMRFNGENAVGLSVIAERGVNIVELGKRFRLAMEEIAPRYAPLELHEAVFQPDRVASRLSELSTSLLSGALLLGALLLLVMGPRMGLVVTAVVPIAALATIAVWGLTGGVLQQISIAALIIALGGLVDNAIVVAESMQFRLDHGETPHASATGSVRELAGPMAAAGLTSLAAFVPMAIAPGTTAEFTRTIPVVSMLAVVVSYVLAVTFTPALGELFLRRRPLVADRRDKLSALADRLGSLAVQRPAAVLIGGTLALLVSFALLPLVRQEFFPSSDRNQLVVDLRLPDGTHLDGTDRAARQLERALLERPDVAAVTTYVGRGVPHFYYNLDSIPWSPSRAQLVVDTMSTADLPVVLDFVRDHGRRELIDSEVVARRLEQGPPIAAPVALRVLGNQPEAMAQAVESLATALRATPGATDVRHTLSAGTPMVEIHIDDAAAMRRGLDRGDVGRSLYGRTRGLPVGELRNGEDPVPILVRSPEGEDRPIDALPALDVEGRNGPSVPLGQVASLAPVWKPASITHRNRQRVVTVFAELEDGATYSDVMRAFSPQLAAMDLPAGITVEVAGAAESSSEANSAMAKALPVGLLLLVGVLVGQFQSFRRAVLVLMTVPLAAVGVVPGLLLGNQPFGFMSLLGVIALAGVVINNSILLLEAIEERRAGGANIRQAVHGAVERRARPILLTAFMTVIGLLPLALSPTTLWPPLAWAMISGLLAATLLTLLLLPALYLLFFAPGEVLRRNDDENPYATETPAASVAALVLVAGLTFAGAAVPVAAQSAPLPGGGAPPASCCGGHGDVALATSASPAAGEVGLGFGEAIARAVNRPEIAAARRRAQAASHGATAERRAALLPVVAVGGGSTQRDRTLELVTPFGAFPFGDARSEAFEVAVVQPLLVADQLLFAAPAARAEASAAALAALRLEQRAAGEAAEAWLDVATLDAQRAAVRAFIASLAARAAETRARVEAGRVLEAEALKVELALDRARQDERSLGHQRGVALRALALAVGQTGAGVEIAGEPPTLGPQLDRESVLAAARAARPDLEALRRQVEAAELRGKGVSAEWWPRLEATARYSWSNGSPYRQDDWVEGGVRLAWNPLAAGTRMARKAAAGEVVAAFGADLVAAERGVELEVDAALAAVEIARGRLAVGERGVVQAGETLRVEQERYAAGRTTTNDLLDAEAALLDQRTLRDVARLDLVRGQVRLAVAEGRIPAF